MRLLKKIIYAAISAIFVFMLGMGAANAMRAQAEEKSLLGTIEYCTDRNATVMDIKVCVHKELELELKKRGISTDYEFGKTNTL